MGWINKSIYIYIVIYIYICSIYILYKQNWGAPHWPTFYQYRRGHGVLGDHPFGLTKSASKWMGGRQNTRSMRHSERNRYNDIVWYYNIPWYTHFITNYKHISIISIARLVRDVNILQVLAEDWTFYLPTKSSKSSHYVQCQPQIQKKQLVFQEICSPPKKKWWCATVPPFRRNFNGIGDLQHPACKLLAGSVRRRRCTSSCDFLDGMRGVMVHMTSR